MAECDRELLENFTHTPLLSPIDSATSHYCQSGRRCLAVRQEIAEAAGCVGEQGCVPAEPGPTGGPFREPAEARWHDISETFTIPGYKRGRLGKGSVRCRGCQQDGAVPPSLARASLEARHNNNDRSDNRVKEGLGGGFICGPTGGPLHGANRGRSPTGIPLQSGKAATSLWRLMEVPPPPVPDHPPHML